MTEQGFIPLSGQLGIPGTSYRLQLGLINEMWASRLLKGGSVLDSYVYKEVKGDFPNQNLIVGWVLRSVAIPNINPHQIMKTTQALVKQAIERKEQVKAAAPLAETKKVKLTKVDEKDIKRPMTKGWVKGEGQKTQSEMEGEARKAFKERMMAKKEEEKTSGEEIPSIDMSRKLPSIPTAETVKTKEFIEQLTPSFKSTTPSKVEATTLSKVEATTPSKVEATTPSKGEATTPSKVEESIFCPYCGKDLNFKFCPYCGKPLPHI
ncbi:MAG: zinc ribbon domain-containing protein [Promethearchaeota archaeon]